MTPQIEFIQQNEVHSGYKITLPSKVADRLIPENNSETRVHWNFNKERKDVVISTVELKENYTSIEAFTKVSNSGHEIVVHKRIREPLKINQDDDLYFVGIAEEEEDDPIPAVLLWTFERMESMISGGSDNHSYNYLRRPRFL